MYKSPPVCQKADVFYCENTVPDSLAVNYALRMKQYGNATGPQPQKKSRTQVTKNEEIIAIHKCILMIGF